METAPIRETALIGWKLRPVVGSIKGMMTSQSRRQSYHQTLTTTRTATRDGHSSEDAILREACVPLDFYSAPLARKRKKRNLVVAPELVAAVDRVRFPFNKLLFI